MDSKRLVILVIFLTTLHLSSQNINDNEIDDSSNQMPNVEQLGSLFSDFIQSEGGKQLGSMLLNSVAAGKGPDASQILDGLNSMLNQNSGNAPSSFDPAALGSMLNLLASATNDQTKSPKESGGFDFGSISTLMEGFFSDPNAPQAALEMLPTMFQTIGAFFGPEADQREANHAGHAWFLPPLLERAHILFDHFMHSELGKGMMQTVGAEKFVKIFADERGKFSFAKFVELLENQSFRRHWIQMVTKRIALVISHIADPRTQKKYLTSAQYLINSFLKGQGYLKAAFFDPLRPTETISAAANTFVKKTFDTKIDSKQYVKPAVEYVKEIFRLAQKKGFLLGSGVDSRALSNKLTDTINLEIIEPIARVYRAYRFAKKVPQCDKYVMCLVNQKQPDEELSLPGLKMLLSRTFSVAASYFISGHTNTPFWVLYSEITEDQNCQAKFLNACNDFHIEEIKVTTEYVHSEL